MTMPDERRRNIGWGPEALEKVAACTALSESLRAHARDLALVHPSVDQILALDGAGQADAVSMLRLLRAAREVMEEAMAALRGIDDRLWHELRTVLRHYPERLDVTHWCSMAPCAANIGSVILSGAFPTRK